MGIFGSTIDYSKVLNMEDNMKRSFFKPERLAYWYFRLNGFLTIENFIVHPDRGRGIRTDADLLAVRFSNRIENVLNPMEDDPKISDCQTLINVIIAEVKKGSCGLNGPWVRSDDENIQRVIRAIGCIPEEDINSSSEGLYKQGVWSNENVTIRLFSIGEYRNHQLPIPSVPQITWSEVIEFCISLFIKLRSFVQNVGIFL